MNLERTLQTINAAVVSLLPAQPSQRLPPTLTPQPPLAMSVLGRSFWGSHRNIRRLSAFLLLCPPASIGHFDRDLGGPNYQKTGPKMLDHEGKAVPGGKGYKYVRVALPLPASGLCDAALQLHPHGCPPPPPPHPSFTFGAIAGTSEQQESFRGCGSCSKRR